MSLLSNALWCIAIFFSVVFFHELGHFLAARFCRVHVTVFSIGFGPKLSAFKDRLGTEWKICALPLGGYVRFEDEHEPAATEPDTDASPTSKNQPKCTKYGSFTSKSLLQKGFIVAAGPAANYVLAFLLYALVFCIYGQQTVVPEVTAVAANSVAERTGIRAGDTIVALNGNSQFSVAEVVDLAQKGTPMTLVLRHLDGTEQTSTLVPEASSPTPGKPQHYVIGIAFTKTISTELSLVSSITEAAHMVFKLNQQMLTALYQMVAGKSGFEIGGPIKIIQISSASAQKGLSHILRLVAILSLNLGLINLLPIPGLDGGHLMLYGLEAIYRKPLPAALKERVVQIGYVLLISLMVFAISSDIISLLRPYR